MRMYFLASAHFKWLVDSRCDVVPVEVHASVFIKSILLSITQELHAWNLQHVRSKKQICHSFPELHTLLLRRWRLLWKNKQKYIHRKISVSFIFIFLDTNCAPGFQWWKIIDKHQVYMPVHGSKGVQAFCTFCIYLYMARTCNWQKRWLIVRTAIWFKTLKSD